LAPHSIEQYIVDELIRDSSNSEIIKGYLDKLDKKDIIEFFDKFLEHETDLGNIRIPVSILANRKLSCLELIVKFLREELRLTNVLVANLLSRSPQVCWTTYSNATKKWPDKLQHKTSRFDIPVRVLREKDKSVLEAIVAYLKDVSGLSFHKIALLLNRDDRTIWTVYNRTLRKTNARQEKNQG